MKTVQLVLVAGLEEIVQLQSRDGPMAELWWVLVQYHLVATLHRLVA